jgi:hypothetical protein
VPGGAVFLLSLVVVFALASTLAAIFIARGRRRDYAAYPSLDDVAYYSDGLLACPRCRGASFQSPPAAQGDFFALALGPFVFGSLSRPKRIVVECVTCGACYQRGSYDDAGAAPAYGHVNVGD